MKAASAELKQKVSEWMEANGGRIYAPIFHPDFASLPVAHGTDRTEIIRPHLAYPGGTVLDIGAHWGFMAHWLEGLGYRVTAVEKAPHHIYILKGLRDICDKQFEVVEGTIFDLKNLTYDIVLALNIFHHLLKKKAKFDKFQVLLKELDCNMMFFQACSMKSEQMKNAFRKMDQDQFAEYVGREARLPNIEMIGSERSRKLYKLFR